MSALDLITNKIEISYDQGKCWVKCYKLALKINRLLKYYDNGKYRFKEGEEAFFRFNSRDVTKLKDVA